MAEKRRDLDVWIVQGNTVYRKVPYTVINDWIQEGRLLAEDKVRASEKDRWHLIGNVPALAAFLPRAEPFPIEDRAEALEPVEAGFEWKRPGEGDEEGDVDMIPLIDISLVLLIFFMMTASISSGLFSPIKTPSARRQLEAIATDMYWVGIDRKGPGGQVETGPDDQPVPWYSFGKGDTHIAVKPGEAQEKDRYDTQDLDVVLGRLGKDLANVRGKVRVRLRADEGLMGEVVRGVASGLQALQARLNRDPSRRAPAERIQFEILGEVSEPQGP